MAPTPQVHIIDRDRLARAYIEALLRSEELSSLSYASTADFLNDKPYRKTGCILLDCVGLVEDDELQPAIGDLRKFLPVIVMVAHAGVQRAVRAMKAGAADFIEKPPARDVLLAAVKMSLSNQNRADLQRETAVAVWRMSVLSPRERQVLEALASGSLNKQIAFDLGLSIRTVEVHRARMMRRLGVRKVAEAIRLFVVAGSVPSV
jgi:two-component system, LuxR family, response regulator FixJ